MDVAVCISILILTRQHAWTATLISTIFTALHWMQGGLVTKKMSVRPSVCPSVERVSCDKMAGRSVTFLSTKLQGIHWPIYPCENDWSERPLLHENLADTDHPFAKCRFWIYFRSYRLSQNTQQKSSINTTRRSTTRFLISLRWILYVDRKPPKRALKRKVSKFKQQSAITSKRYEMGC